MPFDVIIIVGLLFPTAEWLTAVSRRQLKKPFPTNVQNQFFKYFVVYVEVFQLFQLMYLLVYKYSYS